MIIPNCPICFGLGFVCENHPDLAWSEELGRQCGAGEPCERNRVAGNYPGMYSQGQAIRVTLFVAARLPRRSRRIRQLRHGQPSELSSNRTTTKAATSTSTQLRKHSALAQGISKTL
jgi:hypothetical protein